MKLINNLFISIIISALIISAAGAQTIKVDDAKAKLGETATIEIKALNVSDLANFDIIVEYEQSVVKVTEAKLNSDFGNQISNLEHASDGWVRIASLNTGNGFK